MTAAQHYDAHPVIPIHGFDSEIWDGWEQIGQELSRRAAQLREKKRKVVICLDAYPGTAKEDLMKTTRMLRPSAVFDMESCAKPEEVRRKELSDYITEDRVFGVICHKEARSLFDEEKLAKAQAALGRIPEGVIAVVGWGASFLSEGDLYLIADMTRWEIQLRYRAGMPNWCASNGSAPVLTKYKIGYFIEWRLADRYKKERFWKIDYLLEYEDRSRPKMITGEAFRQALWQAARRPFRLEPYFDPGVWGGHWMQEHFGVGTDRQNLAWSFDGVPEENAINLQMGDKTIKIPAMDLVLSQPHPLLGERVHGRYGAEFPIRFDLLDTMGGGNLSLQVHPLTEYIQDTFGMSYTQDESYYLLDTAEDEETYVYLGLKKGVDRDAFEKDLRRSEKGEIAFPAEQYVNRVPVRRHDHVLIPAGTIHCSGRNTMVLEISATPYIFTFKLWDWGRVGLDGVPRPIHVEHGLKNIQWDRDTDFVTQQLIHQEEVLFQDEHTTIEKTGLHTREPIDTIRYSTSVPVEITLNDSVTVANLVEGESARLESVDGSFEPLTIHYAETCILPACLKKCRLVPLSGPVRFLEAYIRP